LYIAFKRYYSFAKRVVDEVILLLQIFNFFPNIWGKFCRFPVVKPEVWLEKMIYNSLNQIYANHIELYSNYIEALKSVDLKS